MRKLFSLSLKEKALDWYRLLDNSHLIDWKELILSFTPNFILFMKFIKIEIISIIYGHMTEKASLKLGGD